MIRPIAKVLVPKNESQFRLLDDPGSDNWNDYKMNGEKVTLYDDKLLHDKRHWCSFHVERRYSANDN